MSIINIRPLTYLLTYLFTYTIAHVLRVRSDVSRLTAIKAVKAQSMDHYLLHISKTIVVQLNLL
jgi:hypothetical protein